MAKELGTPLLILNRAQIRKSYQDLSSALPGVGIYYAIKPLAHDVIIQELEKQGSNFEIATSGEIDLLIRNKIEAKRTIHTHPVKKSKEIDASIKYGCKTFVFDNKYEIPKFRDYKS